MTGEYKVTWKDGDFGGRKVVKLPDGTIARLTPAEGVTAHTDAENVLFWKDMNDEIAESDVRAEVMHRITREIVEERLKKLNQDDDFERAFGRRKYRLPKKKLPRSERLVPCRHCCGEYHIAAPTTRSGCGRRTRS